MFQYKKVTLRNKFCKLSYRHTHMYISSEKDSGGKVIECCSKRLRRLIYSLIGLPLWLITLQS